MNEHIIKTLETQNRELIGFLAQARESRDNWKRKHDAMFIENRMMARRLEKIKEALNESTE